MTGHSSVVSPVGSCSPTQQGHTILCFWYLSKPVVSGCHPRSQPTCSRGSDSKCPVSAAVCDRWGPGSKLLGWLAAWARVSGQLRCQWSVSRCCSLVWCQLLPQISPGDQTGGASWNGHILPATSSLSQRACSRTLGQIMLLCLAPCHPAPHPPASF